MSFWLTRWYWTWLIWEFPKREPRGANVVETPVAGPGTYGNSVPMPAGPTQWLMRLMIMGYSESIVVYFGVKLSISLGYLAFPVSALGFPEPLGVLSSTLAGSSRCPRTPAPGEPTAPSAIFAAMTRLLHPRDRPGCAVVTLSLRKADMEPEKGPFREGRILWSKGPSFGFHVSFLECSRCYDTVSPVPCTDVGRLGTKIPSQRVMLASESALILPSVDVSTCIMVPIHLLHRIHAFGSTRDFHSSSSESATVDVEA